MVILLMLALLIIALTAIAPREAAQIRRDREEEMVHRGNEYARAVKRFYRKIGRYPVRIEELENTNNTRFLRRRYQDPITGEDFRILHYGEQKTTPKGFFGAPFTATGAGAAGGAGFSAGGGGGLAGAIIGNAMGGNPLGGGSTSGGGPTFGGGTPPATGAGGDAGPQPGASNVGTPASNLGNTLGSGPTFGGGAIIGVAGTKDQASIKTWNDKTNYREWEFYYDPRFDRQTQQGAVPGVGGGIPGGVGQPGKPGGGGNPNPQSHGPK